MTLTLDLTPEQEALLHAEASRRGLPVQEYALQALDTGLRAGAASAAPADLPQTGAEALAYWTGEGVLGLFADRPDSAEYARQLRRQAETRKPMPG
jgi:hypothetical protein